MASNSKAKLMSVAVEPVWSGPPDLNTWRGVAQGMDQTFVPTDVGGNEGPHGWVLVFTNKTKQIFIPDSLSSNFCCNQCVGWDSVNCDFLAKVAVCNLALCVLPTLEVYFWQPLALTMHSAFLGFVKWNSFCAGGPLSCFKMGSLQLKRTTLW